MIKILFSFFIILLSPLETKAVVGGNTSEEWSEEANLYKYVIKLSSCTVTRIGTRFLLTAAHCWAIEGADRELSFTYGANGEKTGKLSIVKKYSFVNWQEYLSHHSNENTPSDLQVYEVTKDSIKELSEIKIASINFNDIPKKNDMIFITGYGGYKEELAFTNQDGRVFYRAIGDGRFRIGKRRITDVDKTFIFISQFNTDGKELRLAKGDSGGPVFNKDQEVIGVNAYIDRYSFPDFWSAMSRTDQYASSSITNESISEWIKQFTLIE